jgi:hypothetical protein
MRRGFARPFLNVMAGLGPATHVSATRTQDVGARAKPGHDSI